MNMRENRMAGNFRGMWDIHDAGYLQMAQADDLAGQSAGAKCNHRVSGLYSFRR
jgi:hypothetical protein